MQYEAADVHAALEYMSTRRNINQSGGRVDPNDPFPRNPQLNQIYHRGKRVLGEAQIKYSTSSAEARAAPRDSPIVRKVYRGHSSWYWLRNRSDANSERKGKK